MPSDAATVDPNEYEVRDTRRLLHRVFMSEPEGVAVSVGDVPVCPTCLRAFQASQYGPDVCEDCFEDDITTSECDSYRFITEYGDKRHFDARCHHIRDSQYWMVSKEHCDLALLGKCSSCRPPERSTTPEIRTDGGTAQTDTTLTPEDVEEIKIERATLQTTDRNMYRIDGLEPSGDGCDFSLYLNAEVGDALKTMADSDRQSKLEEVLSEPLDEMFGDVRFHEDSLLLSNISVAGNAAGLDLQKERSDGYVYRTHNVDSSDQAINVIAVFANWVSFALTLLKSDIEATDAGGGGESVDKTEGDAHE